MNSRRSPPAPMPHRQQCDPEQHGPHPGCDRQPAERRELPESASHDHENPMSSRASPSASSTRAHGDSGDWSGTVMRRVYSLLSVACVPRAACADLWASNRGGPMSEKTDVQQGTLALMILKTLDTLGPLHGYGVARRIEQTSGDLLSVNYGTIYPALLKLEQEGAIASSWGVSENNRKAKYLPADQGRQTPAREGNARLGADGHDPGALSLARAHVNGQPSPVDAPAHGHAGWRRGRSRSGCRDPQPSRTAHRRQHPRRDVRSRGAPRGAAPFRPDDDDSRSASLVANGAMARPDAAGSSLRLPVDSQEPEFQCDRHHLAGARHRRQCPARSASSTRSF